jgi:hypothetical protein
MDAAVNQNHAGWLPKKRPPALPERVAEAVSAPGTFGSPDSNSNWSDLFVTKLSGGGTMARAPEDEAEETGSGGGGCQPSGGETSTMLPH